MSVFLRDDKRLVYVPLEEAIIPPAGLINHYKDYWWCVDPERGLIFFNSRGAIKPQANSNRLVTDHFIMTMYPWAEVKLVPSVFRKACFF